MDFAKETALVIISAAREHGYLDRPLAVMEAMAPAEKNFFVALFQQFAHHHPVNDPGEIAQEELASLFTFCCVRAAETVYYVRRNLKLDFDFRGMTGGEIPFAASEGLQGYFKRLELPVILGGAFADWAESREEELEESHTDRLLVLFEALKWSWRVAAHLAILYCEREEELEKQGRP